MPDTWLRHCFLSLNGGKRVTGAENHVPKFLIALCGDDEGDFEGLSDPSYHLPPEIRMNSLDREQVLAIMRAGTRPTRLHPDILPKLRSPVETLMILYNQTLLSACSRRGAGCCTVARSGFNEVCFALNPTFIWLTRTEYCRTPIRCHFINQGWVQVHRFTHCGKG